MEKKVFIEGMTCQHCQMRVEKALSKIDGVTKASVNLEGKFAIVELNKAVSDTSIIETVDDAGYKVNQIK